MNVWDDEDLNWYQPFGWSDEVWPDDLFWSKFTRLDLTYRNLSPGLIDRVSVDLIYNQN